MNYKISFCIPTYNRSKYIGETLDSIICQANKKIEIIISDNASTDDTEEIIKKYKTIFPNITYFKWTKNMGADLNYLKTVELATGDYCWFLGSDDIIKQGAIKRMLSEIEEGNDIYLCSEYFCDIKLKPYHTHYLLPFEKNDSIYNLSDRNELIEYFSLAQSHSALFGYLSCIVFNRDKWCSIKYNDSYTGTLYSHMFMLYSFINKGCKLKYIKDPLVFWRGGNDSFGGSGKIQSRYMIDIDGFTKIIEDFFINDKEIITAFQGAFRRHHVFKNIAYFRLNVKVFSDWKDIERKLINDLSYDPVKLFILRYDFIKPFLFLAFRLHRAVTRTKRLLQKLPRYSENKTYKGIAKTKVVE